MHSRTLLFGSTLLKHGRHFAHCNQPLNMRMRVCHLVCHFAHCNQPLNMRMRVCHLDCHEAGLCCYLAIYTENLLRPL
jgi:hypothetical protein